MIEGISGTNQTGTISSANSKTVSKDEFLKLLTYQLKAQNPLQPYNNQEFAAQLAQFSQLEQLTEIRSLLEEQVNTNLLLTNTISNTALPGLIGKNAKAASEKVHFDGEKDCNVGYTLSSQAQSAELTIKDSNGKVVRTIQIDKGELSKGDHEIVWDGKNNDGKELEAGDFTFSVDYKDLKGNEFLATTFLSGTIQAVRFKSEGTVMVISGVEIALQDVYDISTEN